MYENLIATLRFCATNGSCPDCPTEFDCAGTMGDGLYTKAADAIEELENEVMIYRAVGSIEEVRSMKEWMDMSMNDVRINTLAFIKQMREIVAEEVQYKKSRRNRK